MSMREIVTEMLKRDEKERGQPYDDATGQRIRAPKGNVTIGIGRDLDANPLTQDEMRYLLNNDIDAAQKSASALIPNFYDLSDNRQAVLVNMAFNMGRDRLAKFRKLIKAVSAFDFTEAYVQMISSAWADQVGQRAIRLAKLMKDDK